MTSDYHPAHSKERYGKKTETFFFTEKYVNHFIFLNVYINQKKLELYSHKQAFLRQNS